MSFNLKKACSPKQLLLVLLSFLLLPLFVLTGCDDSSSNNIASGNGTVFIDVTDAEGDFDTYEVDLISILLTRTDGTEVEALASSSRIDFTEVIEQSEFISATDIPSGSYTQAMLRLDYANSDVQVEVNGAPTAASVIDSDGNPVSQLDIEVVFDRAHPLIIRPGGASQATFDFDLKASHEVDTSNAALPLVTVTPFILATVDDNAPKQQRLRGPLASIDSVQQQFTLAIRPFRHHLNHFGKNGHFGKITVATDNNTEFEVDGAPAQGVDGFALLAAKPLTTAIIVHGILDRPNKRFHATHVNAGSSVPGGTLDVIRGDIIARDATQMTVRGALLIRGNGSISRNIDVDIALPVHNPAQPIDILSTNNTVPPSGIHSLSVGQHVTILGEMLATIQVVGVNPAMDIRQGHVRVHRTRLLGTVRQITTTGNAIGDSFSMNLLRINKRPIAAFDFANTGSDPTNYQVQGQPTDISALVAPNIVSGKRVVVTGNVMDFGNTPPDFIADTIIDPVGQNALMGIDWRPASSSPFSSLSSNGLTIDMSTVGPHHHVLQNDSLTPLAATPAPQIIANATHSGKFALHSGRRIRMFKDFSAFTAALGTLLQEGASIHRLHAKGHYDEALQTLTANKAWVAIRPLSTTPIN